MCSGSMDSISANNATSFSMRLMLSPSWRLNACISSNPIAAMAWLLPTASALSSISTSVSAAPLARPVRGRLVRCLPSSFSSSPTNRPVVAASPTRRRAILRDGVSVRGASARPASPSRSQTSESSTPIAAGPSSAASVLSLAHALNASLGDPGATSALSLFPLSPFHPNRPRSRGSAPAVEGRDGRQREKRPGLLGCLFSTSPTESGDVDLHSTSQGVAGVAGVALPLSRLTRSAYRSVLSEFSHADPVGAMLAIMAVRPFPIKLSLSTCVSLLLRKGVCDLRLSMARIHSFNARRLLLI
mmetsp:Transcript_48831/g.114679  ORF Transcript_48831/g.114679 Transcript_48831/m.114679 type:complete len:301 (-) Transcript_48831:652-1554(-)